MFIGILFKILLDLILIGVMVFISTLIIGFVVIVIKSLIDTFREFDKKRSSRK